MNSARVKMRYPDPRPTLVDFFSGAGGMSLGFEQAGFDVLLGVDRDGHHVATHERNFPYGKAICASVVDLDAGQVAEFVDGRDIDLVIGGPPCQGFSHMGLRDLNDPRNSLIDHFVRLVLGLRPKAFVMENVPGLLSSKTRHVLDTLISVAESNGYAITKPVRILDAADFGVPQSRRRLFVIGVRTDVAQEISYPDGLLAGQPVRPTVREAISDLPHVERYDCLFRRNQIAYDSDPESQYAKVLRGVLVDPSDLSHPREWDNTICSGCLRTRHAPKTVELYDATLPGDTVPGHKLPRLDPHGIAPTLRAGSDSTHGSYTAPRPVHPVMPRCITSREAARLHGFPDWFAFYPLKWHAYRQIGNAVCPPVARAIGRRIAEVLELPRTNRPPKPVALYDSFALPDNRPRTLKRIPVMVEFPPIIEFLFDRAYSPKSKRLKRPRFTFADVEHAIAATNSNLHWVRKETFLPEIARSRRARQILEPCLRHGFSIAICNEGDAIGEFVPQSSSQRIDDRDSLAIRIGEIQRAVAVPISLDSNGSGFDHVFQLFARPEFVEAMWGSGARVTIESGSRSRSFAFTAQSSLRSKKRRWVGLACTSRSLPTKTRIAEIAESKRADDAMVIASATSRHVVAMRFAGCRTHPREICRTAFEYSE